MEVLKIIYSNQLRSKVNSETVLNISAFINDYKNAYMWKDSEF